MPAGYLRHGGEGGFDTMQQNTTTTQAPGVRNIYIRSLPDAAAGGWRRDIERANRSMATLNSQHKLGNYTLVTTLVTHNVFRPPSASLSRVPKKK